MLHELFGYGHGEIAEVVGKSSANCRQILARARRHVEQGRPRFEPSRREREALLARFLDAVRAGDVQALVDLLAADAVSYADGGGKARATRLPIYGAAKVARLWAKLGADRRPRGIAPRRRQRPARRRRHATRTDASIGVLTLEVAAGRVQAVWAGGQPGQAGPGPRPGSVERHVRLAVAVEPAGAACTCRRAGVPPL